MRFLLQAICFFLERDIGVQGMPGKIEEKEIGCEQREDRENLGTKVQVVREKESDVLDKRRRVLQLRML